MSRQCCSDAYVSRRVTSPRHEREPTSMSALTEGERTPGQVDPTGTDAFGTDRPDIDTGVDDRPEIASDGGEPPSMENDLDPTALIVADTEGEPQPAVRRRRVPWRRIGFWAAVVAALTA